MHLTRCNILDIGALINTWVFRNRHFNKRLVSSSHLYHYLDQHICGIKCFLQHILCYNSSYVSEIASLCFALLHRKRHICCLISITYVVHVFCRPYSSFSCSSSYFSLRQIFVCLFIEAEIILSHFLYLHFCLNGALFQWLRAFIFISSQSNLSCTFLRSLTLFQNTLISEKVLC